MALPLITAMVKPSTLEVEQAMLSLPQVDCPLQHHFAPGVYVREIFMPKGSIVLGHAHKTEHLNILIAGRINILDGDNVLQMRAPCTFVSKAGVRKLLYMLDDTVYATIHPTDETDVDLLEEQLVEKSETWKQAQIDEQQIKKIMEEAV